MATIENQYSAKEVELIYSLGRFYLETGKFQSANYIFAGLCQIAPDYVPAWLGKASANFLLSRVDEAKVAASHALRLMPESVEAQFMLITALLGEGDFSAAGAKLGEIKDLVDNQKIRQEDLLRYFQMLMLRFEYRV